MLGTIKAANTDPIILWYLTLQEHLSIGEKTAFQFKRGIESLCLWGTGLKTVDTTDLIAKSVVCQTPIRSTYDNAIMARKSFWNTWSGEIQN